MGKPVNIAAIVPYKIYPATTGGQKFNALTYEYLSQLLPVTVISTKNNVLPAGLKSAFIPLLGNSVLRYINPLLFFRIRNIVRKTNSSHLVLAHPYFGWLGILIKWFTNVKLVIHSHNIESIRFKSVGKWWWRILWHYEKVTHAAADINFFITEEDRQYGIAIYKLAPEKCHILTYGTQLTGIPSEEERAVAKKMLQYNYGISADEKILLFNGALDYKPNLDAVHAIVDQINPRLLAEKDFKYKIVICGKGLPREYDGLKEQLARNIIYAGFVDDITAYFKGADIFINPVIDGGGIKTKLVEGLGLNLSAVSFASGAFGVSLAVTGNKLHIVPDSEWRSFVAAILEIDTTQNIPSAFFNHFYWGNIAARAYKILTAV